ncbi:uncharacterized protein LOC100821537 isoform X4 [Brachypodium distachyon]|uniref:uncharacterized protein LOC100821537 isoform X4 n=1 Tax=Brachypodium distachyon TaxID=15368 RepID=UPI000D0DA27B|nr:uncharacterized protein LOC100821537 isoform X4 [Brachypodium distachyon]|eukprot:XP_024315925.1 uncharacterized protein LOC100821537 isoform X4 [Brachypodium distachyon]
MKIIYSLIIHIGIIVTVVNEYDKVKQCCPKFVTRNPTCLFIREPSNTSNLSYESGDADALIQLATTFSTNSTLTSIARMEHGESSKEQKKAKQDRARARRQSLTLEQRQQMNARRRALRPHLTSEKKEEFNARRRALRQSLPPQERHALLDRRKASYRNKRDTVCVESIAMRCPKLGASSIADPSLSTSASTITKATFVEDIMDEDTIPELGGSSIADPLLSTLASTIAEDDTSTFLEDIMDEDTIPELGTLPPAQTSTTMPEFTIGTDDDVQNFINEIMDEDTIPEEDMDEEYYLFASEVGGHNNEVVNPDESMETSAAVNSALDPYDYVYSDIPERTHVLKPVPDCEYCGAKKFEYEVKSFCCREGKVRLVNPEPPLELRRLWSSEDTDAKHFRDNIRFFNGHFSFTTLGVNLDNKYTNMRSGVYTFRGHGQIYHNIHSFGSTNSSPSHLQLYFYDDDQSLQHRFRHSPNLDQEVTRKLVDILKDNPYSKAFRSLGQVENVLEYRITLNTDYRMDQQTYNVPLSSEVAAVWVEGNDLIKRFKRSIILYGNNNVKHHIEPFYGCYDPLSYPLFFPRGELGWHPHIPKYGVSLEEVLRYHDNNSNDNPDMNNRLCVSVRDYYCHKFQKRPGIFNAVLYGKRLLQQYAVDMYMKIEGTRLDYYRIHHKELRADLYKGIVDSLQAGESRADAVGKRIILPSTFIGGKRDMKRRFMDAMALVQKYGKPDIFLTMTCNPKWEEITNGLEPGQTPQDRPDLIVWVFKAKLEVLKIQLFKNHILGKVIAYVYVIEFQKRGLPHAHFLLIMELDYKLLVPEQYDHIISAELPDKQNYPELYAMVVNHMMHGPCGVFNPKNVCMQNRACKNHYPRPFNPTTLQGKDAYPVYRRRDNGRRAQVRGHMLDNRWVVPYNPYLLRMFNCHINVEVCSSIKAVKYLFKYIYKGHDRALMSLDEPDSNGNIDEIKQYRDARWVTPPEALWRIYSFDLSEMRPSVKQLQLHLPEMHMISFEAGQDLNDVVTRHGASRTMLTEYFEANKKFPKAR